MQTYAVTYVYNQDDAGRVANRPAHRAYLQALAVAGSIQASGPVQHEGMTGALIIIRAADAAAALALLEQDPFWQMGLIADRAVVEWNIVIGPWAQL